MQTFNNVQINGWSCSFKHGPAHFPVLKQFFVWMVWSFSKTFKTMTEPCSPKYGPVLFTVLKNPFVWIVCSLLDTFKFMAGARSPTSPVTAKLILRRWKIVSFWCYADFQQRSSERMIVLPQTRSSSFHGVEKVLGFGKMKVFKTIRFDGQAVLSKTRPSFFHGVDEIFRLSVVQPVELIQVYDLAALPNLFCHGPAQFAALKNLFVVKLCRLSTTFKWMDGRAPPNTVQRLSRCWRFFSSG